MRYLLLMALATVLVCGGCSESLPAVLDGGTSDSDSDTDTDTDSDSNLDSDSDSDTDTPGCNAPEGITNWGGPCHTNADCPTDTECIILDGMDQTQGFCAAECCNFATMDPAYCTDVAGGQEGCVILLNTFDFGPPYYCMINCNTVADCPLGSDCVAAGSQNICSGFAPEVDAGPDGG